MIFFWLAEIYYINLKDLIFSPTFHGQDIKLCESYTTKRPTKKSTFGSSTVRSQKDEQGRSMAKVDLGVIGFWLMIRMNLQGTITYFTKQLKENHTLKKVPANG